MMVMAVGLSSYNIALFHLINHAFYKALLFLGAGSVIHAVADNQDFRKFGGLISYLPLTYSVMLIASLSLVAFPFMTGFYSKDFILESAYGQFSFSGVAVYIIATIGAIFTTLYSVKVLYLTFIANPNGPRTYYSLPVDNLFSNTKSYKPAHEGDLFLSLPLVILALFSIFFGFITKDIFIGLGSNFFVDNSLFIHPIHEIMIDTEFAVPVLFKLLPFIFTISFSIIALTLSELLSELVIYFKFSRLGYNIFGFFNQRFLIEFFYNKYITNLILNLGGQITKILDKGSIELFGPFGLEKGLVRLSKNISYLSTSHVTTYALYILVGFITYLLYYSSQLDLCLTLIILLLMIGNNDSSANSSDSDSDSDREINYNNNYNKQPIKNSIIHIHNQKMMFSTSATLLYADNNNNNNNDNNHNDNINSDSNYESDNDSSSGYGTDSNRSYFEEGADAMFGHPVRDIPEDHLRRYINDTRDIVSNPWKAGVERPEDRDSYLQLVDRHRELTGELRRRKDEGMIPDSSSPSEVSLLEDNSGEGDVSRRSDNEDGDNSGAGAGAGAGAGSLSGGNSGNGSSSTNKRNFEGYDDNKSADTQPSESKRFKQDSSDITGDTEPFDFGGGDD